MIWRRGTSTARCRSRRRLASPNSLPSARSRPESSAQVGEYEGGVVACQQGSNTREVPRQMPGRNRQRCHLRDTSAARTSNKSGVRRSPATYGILRQPCIFIFTDTRCRFAVCRIRVTLSLYHANNRYHLTDMSGQVIAPDGICGSGNVSRAYQGDVLRRSRKIFRRRVAREGKTAARTHLSARSSQPSRFNMAVLSPRSFERQLIKASL